MTAIVLAGERDGEQALARHAGVACKALVEIAGVPVLARVIRTLREAESVHNIIVSGPVADRLRDQPTLNHLLQADDVHWQPPQSSPSRSAWHAPETLPPRERVLLTTADHPLLTSQIVDRMHVLCNFPSTDLVVGLAPFPLVREKYPGLRKTVLHFRDGGFCVEVPPIHNACPDSRTMATTYSRLGRLACD